MNNNKVWYITGASQGFGLALVRQLLAGGYRVAATSRDVAKLQKAVDRAGEKIESMRSELDRWKTLSTSADYQNLP